MTGGEKRLGGKMKRDKSTSNVVCGKRTQRRQTMSDAKMTNERVMEGLREPMVSIVKYDYNNGDEHKNIVLDQNIMN